MNRFSYQRAVDVADAMHLAWAARGSDLKFLAGGTNLVDLMKEEVEHPDTLIDISRLPLDAIVDLPGSGLRLGALARNADTARHPAVRARYPLLAEAILAGASQQLRNAATNGGNLNQRTRCYYFYDTATACNKRQPGSGCSALEAGAVRRIHAILGGSDQCIAVHPSDMCVALAVLEPTVQVAGPNGERAIAFADYHRLPGDYPAHDNTLAAGELVTAIDLPAESFAAHYSYLKVRDRQSYAFALVSVAAVLALDAATGHISEARVALGGVAHKPWRVQAAEAVLIGELPSDALFDVAAEGILRGAVGREGNAYKIELARRAIVRALSQAVLRAGPAG